MVSDTGDVIRVHWDALAVEGLDTGDGRFLTPEGGTHRALPLPLLALPYKSHGGDDAPAAEVFGRLTTLDRRPGPEVTRADGVTPFPDGTYVWSASAEIDGTHTFADLVRKGYLRGGSIDIGELDAELVDDETAAMSGNPKRRAIMRTYEIAGATMVPVPAFADAYCQLADDPGAPVALAAAALPEGMLTEPQPMWEATGLGDFLKRTPSGAGHAMKDGSFPIETRTDLGHAIERAGSAKDPASARKFIIAQARRLNASDMIPSNWNPGGTLKEDKAMAASATTITRPATPSIDWFRNPGLDTVTIPPVITDDGRVYGHVAAWTADHIGYIGRRMPPPRSRTDYAYFHTGAALVAGDDGQIVTIPAGHLALDTGHAAMTADYAAAAAHYDNTGSIVADVCAGEDEHGIWVAGALAPGVSDTQLHKLRTCALSGDWRRIGAGLEMVAAISVPTPGFPEPRARVASGVPLALVAAGTLIPQVTLAQPGSLDYVALADTIVDRMEVRRHHAAELAQRRDALLEQIGAFTSADLDALLGQIGDDAPGDFSELFTMVGEPTRDELAGMANWVEKAGGLPKYIKRITKHLQEKGMDQSRAIATAVNVAKKSCSSGDTNWPGLQHVNPGSRAEACAAVADWEKKKAAS